MTRPERGADLPSVTPPGYPAPGARELAVSERIRRRSKLLFGNRDRLEVAAAIAARTDPVVAATDLTWELRLASNRVRAQLLALAEVGLLDEPGIRGARGERLFMRREDPFWDWCAALYRECQAEL